MSSGQLGFILWAPDTLAWWYYQEHGTVGGYPIDPVNAKFLSWPEPQAQGGIRRALHVIHPGVKPKHMITNVWSEIKSAFAVGTMQALRESEFDMALVQETILSTIGPAVKDIVVASIAEQLPTSRLDGGKLAGEAPADVFAAETEIRPLT